MLDPKIQRLETEIERLKSAIQELTVLNDIAIAASSALEVGEMLDIIVEKSIKAVRAEQGSILLLTEEDDSPLKTLIRQEDFSKSQYASYKVGANITGWVMKHEQPLKIDDLATDTRFATTEQERQEIRSALCIPIRFRAKLLGILIATNKKTRTPFSESDLRLLSIIAAQSGQLIRNSQLQEETIDKKRMEHELGMARNIQKGLLPTESLQNEHLEIASYFNAADEISGDYFDYFDLGEGRIGIVVADVSGHGTSSALMMTMVKGILHSLTYDFSSADRLLTKTNVILSQIMPKEMFVTVVFLVVDSAKRTLHFSNAGHNPLLFYHAQSQSCELVELRGPALGLTTLAKYSEKEIGLHSGDVFVLYTDGVTEAFNSKKEMFEETRLIRAVQASANGSVAAVITSIRRDLKGFTGESAQSDDVAIIAVKLK
ncbi:MAG: PP2C family protein-serine/threonine phosphatase [bacterium]